MEGRNNSLTITFNRSNWGVGFLPPFFFLDMIKPKDYDPFMSQPIFFFGIKNPNPSVYFKISGINEPIELKPEASQKIINHSPDGFQWGYSGSGPSQLALAILLKVFSYKFITNPKYISILSTSLYVDFKQRFVSNWGDIFAIDSEEIMSFYKKEIEKLVSQ